jgi:hypothetical protein
MRTWQKVPAKKLVSFTVALLVASVPFFWSVPAYAEYHGELFRHKSLSVSSSVPSLTTKETISLTVPQKIPVRSIKFTYCDLPLIAEQCSPPKGLDVSNAKLLSQTSVTGFTMLQRSQHQFVLTRALANPAHGKISFHIGNVVNPSFLGTFFVRITTYTSPDGSGTENGHGTVASSTANTINVSTKVPPILNFCVGVQIPKSRDCSSATGHLIDMGTLTPRSTGKGSSQMLVATNASYGFGITAIGDTMSSGVHTIPALSRPTYSAPGNSQFGINLRANSNPAVGSNSSGKGTATPSNGYNVANQFMFHDGDTVAASNGVTDFNRFTVSYITNVASSQPSGVYATTITYICSATF